MKDELLINSGFLINFWAKAIDTLNYLQNKLSTKYSKCTVIPKKAWIGHRQDVQYLQIFGYKISTFIPSKKYTKSNIHKTWRRIFIVYTDSSKHVRV